MERVCKDNEFGNIDRIWYEEYCILFVYFCSRFYNVILWPVMDYKSHIEDFVRIGLANNMQDIDLCTTLINCYDMTAKVMKLF